MQRYDTGRRIAQYQQTNKMNDINLTDTLTGLSLSAGYLESILPELEKRYELDLAGLLSQSGIEQEDFSDPSALIPFYKVAALFMLVFQASKDFSLGLHIGELVQIKSFQVLGYAVYSSSTLREAIDRLVRYERLVGELGRTVLEENGGYLCLKWHCPIESDGYEMVVEAAITGWVVIGTQLVANSYGDFEVFFAHSGPEDISDYERVYKTRVEFNADFSGVRIKKDLLNLPVTTADPGLKSIIDQHAQTLLTEFSSKMNLLNEVRASVYQSLADGEPAVETIAAKLELTPRALQNRLKSQGVNFTQLVDEVRKLTALQYIKDKSMNLLDIAFLLGFSEQSSFNRAFKRWTEKAPGEYRKTLKSD